jgi:hypothetical protein
MESIVPFKIQIASILASVCFLLYVGHLILKGRLREEYAVVWAVSTLVLLLFSFWRDGLRVVSQGLGVFYPPSLVFMAAIFCILIYLLHLSVSVSRLQTQNKTLAQEVALLREDLRTCLAAGAEPVMTTHTHENLDRHPEP